MRLEARAIESAGDRSGINSGERRQPVPVGARSREIRRHQGNRGGEISGGNVTAPGLCIRSGDGARSSRPSLCRPFRRPANLLVRPDGRTSTRTVAAPLVFRDLADASWLEVEHPSGNRTIALSKIIRDGISLSKLTQERHTKETSMKPLLNLKLVALVFASVVVATAEKSAASGTVVIYCSEQGDPFNTCNGCDQPSCTCDSSGIWYSVCCCDSSAQ
jgi:hypothetical protein